MADNDIKWDDNSSSDIKWDDVKWDDDQPEGKGILDYLKQFGKDTGGAAVGLGDIAAGAVSAPIGYLKGSLGILAGHDPKAELEEARKVAGDNIGSAINKIGLGDPRENEGYKAAMLPFEKIGEGLNWASDKLGLSPSSRLALEGGLTVAPLPFLHQIGGAAKAVGRGVVDAVPEGLGGLRATEQATRAGEVVQGRPTIADQKVAEQAQLQTQLEQQQEAQRQASQQGLQDRQINWDQPDAQADMMAPINPYDVGGHVTNAMDGRETVIGNDPQADMFTRPEDATAIPRGLADQSNMDMRNENQGIADVADLENHRPEYYEQSNMDPYLQDQGILFDQVDQRFNKTSDDILQAIEERRPQYGYNVTNDVPMQPDVTQPMRDALSEVPGLKKVLPDQDGTPPPPPEAKAPTDTPIEQATNGVKGLSDAAKGYVYENLTPDQVIERASGEKDGSPSMLGRVLASGANMMSQLRKSTLIKGAYQFMNKAEGGYSKTVRQDIVPIEKTLNALTKGDKQSLAAFLKDELFNRQRGDVTTLNSKLQDAYTKLRVGYEKVGNMLNEARSAAGLEPITLHDFYVSSRWRGNFKSEVKDASGKTLWFLREQSKKALEASKKALDAKMKGLTYTDVDQRFKTPSDTLEAGYHEMLKLLDPNDPRVKELQSIYEQGITENSMDSLGMPNHFENKANVRGFLGDRPNVSDHRNAIDLLNSQVQYMKNAAKWSHQQEAVANIKQLISDPHLKETQPNNVKYVEEYTKHALGFGTNAEIKAVESSIARGLGYDREQVVGGLNNLRSYFYTKNLGLLNVKAALVQAIQPIFNIPMHLDMMAKGLKANPVTVAAKTIQDFMFPNKSTVGTEALKYAHDNGFLAINVLDDVRDIGQSKAHQTFTKVANINQVKAEEFARTYTYLSMVHHLNEAGLTGETLYSSAAAATNRVMVDYRKFEQPMWMERGGLLTKSAGTLKNFTNNQYNQLRYYGMQAKRGNVAPLAAFMGIQFALAGTMGMYGVDSVTTAYDNYIKPALGPKYTDKSAKSWILEHMSDAMAYGGLSKLTGVNLFGSLSQGTIGGNSLGDIAAPFVSDIAKSGNAAANLVRQGMAAGGLPVDKESAMQDVYENMPPHMRGAMESSLSMLKNNGVSLNPRDLDKGNFRRTPTEDVMRYAGATSFRESSAKDRAYTAGKRELDINSAKEQLGDQYVKAIRNGDAQSAGRVVEQMKQWMGPDELSNYLVNRVKTSITQRNQDVTQRAMPKTVNNVSQQQKYLRMQQITGQP